MNLHEACSKVFYVTEKLWLSTPDPVAHSLEAKYLRFAAKFVTDPAETMAWKAATISGLDGGDAPLITNYDVIIVDDKPETMAKAIESSLPLLSSDGVLVTTEPMVPTGDVDEGDDERMALVNGFNDWMNLIKACHQDYHIAFVPVFEGTIVTFLKKIS